MKKILALLLLVSQLPLLAEIKLPPLFSDGMVLQQKLANPVWGWAPAGTEVSVSIASQTKTTTANASGKWMLKLDPLVASSEAKQLIITVGTETKTISDVLVGEVWLCSGQSNMNSTLGDLTKHPGTEKNQAVINFMKKEMENSKDPLMRHITVKRARSPFSPLDNFQGSWISSSPESNSEFSAVGYFFARELRKKLNVPVGLIKSAFGGSLLEPWIPMEAYQETEALKSFYQKEAVPLKKQREEFLKNQMPQKNSLAIKEWKRQVKIAKTNKTEIPKRPKTPSTPGESIRVPSTLYNSMIHPLVPYGIKGVLWYQGEANTTYNADQYKSRFISLITAWRKVWGEGDFPFYYVQIANYFKPQLKPGNKSGWGTIRDQQRRALELKNTGMAIINDIGEKSIHPMNKVDVGKRLSLLALKNDYNIDIKTASGPLYKSVQFSDAKAIINFTECGEGLMIAEKTGLADPIKSDKPLAGFQICGKDHKWKWAEVKIISNTEIEVKNSEISEPVEVRYFWFPNMEGQVRLYNSANLPASGFTTEK